MLFKWIILECLCGKLRVKIANETTYKGRALSFYDLLEVDKKDDDNPLGLPVERSPDQICDAILLQAHDDLDDAIQMAEMYLKGITPLRHLLAEIDFMEGHSDE